MLKGELSLPLPFFARNIGFFQWDRDIRRDTQYCRSLGIFDEHLLTFINQSLSQSVFVKRVIEQKPSGLQRSDKELWKFVEEAVPVLENKKKFLFIMEILNLANINIIPPLDIYYSGNLLTIIQHLDPSNAFPSRTSRNTVIKMDFKINGLVNAGTPTS